MKILFNLFWAFFKIGSLTFGGGLTMLPMLEQELVTKRKWITSEELLDCYAIGNCTPGIIAINTATFIGYKKAGVAGGIFATLGMVTPSVVIITIVATCLQKFMQNKIFLHAMIGVRAVVCALLSNTVITLARKTLVNWFSCVICVLVFIAAFFLKAPTILLVVIAAIVGIIFDKITGKKKENKNDK